MIILGREACRKWNLTNCATDSLSNIKLCIFHILNTFEDTFWKAKLTKRIKYCDCFYLGLLKKRHMRSTYCIFYNSEVNVQSSILKKIYGIKVFFSRKKKLFKYEIFWGCCPMKQKKKPVQATSSWMSGEVKSKFKLSQFYSVFWKVWMCKSSCKPFRNQEVNEICFAKKLLCTWSW